MAGGSDAIFGECRCCDDGMARPEKASSVSASRSSWRRATAYMNGINVDLI